MCERRLAILLAMLNPFCSGENAVCNYRDSYAESEPWPWYSMSFNDFENAAGLQIVAPVGNVVILKTDVEKSMSESVPNAGNEVDVVAYFL